MNGRRRFLGALCVTLLGSVTPVLGQLDEARYRLAPGDVIQIRVFGEPDLSFGELRLDDSGAFSFPFLGRVSALDLTANELQRRLQEGLEGDFLVNPRLSVSIVSYRPFFVNGEVRSPGGYAWQPGLTVRQATSLAGGLTERASRRRITVIREKDATRQPESVEMDSPVNPGDILEIRQGLF